MLIDPVPAVVTSRVPFIYIFMFAPSYVNVTNDHALEVNEEAEVVVMVVAPCDKVIVSLPEVFPTSNMNAVVRLAIPSVFANIACLVAYDEQFIQHEKETAVVGANAVVERSSLLVVPLKFAPLFILPAEYVTEVLVPLNPPTMSTAVPEDSSSFQYD